jgi:hypothetical protein
MQLRNPISARIAVLFLIPIAASILRWYQWRNLSQQLPYFKQSQYGADKITTDVLWLLAAFFSFGTPLKAKPQPIGQHMSPWQWV